MQDLDEKNSYVSLYQDYLIQIDDVLKIDISAPNSEYQLSKNDPVARTQNSTRESLIFDGYMVDTDGNIEIASIGKIKALGLSIIDLENEIYSLYTKNDILSDPYIDIKILNAQFTILGEVNKPGNYYFIENNLDILQAIGMAGDLTINGKRKGVKLIREINNAKSVFSVDLTNSDFLSSKKFQIFSGDIIIVAPNSTRIKNAGIIGNSGTLISLLSFILSSIIVVSSTN